MKKSFLLGMALLAGGALAQPQDGQWTMAGRDHANTRFSALDQIDTGNVAKLQLAFSYSTGLLRGHEAAPIVAGDTMFSGCHANGGGGWRSRGSLGWHAVDSDSVSTRGPFTAVSPPRWARCPHW